MERINWEVRVAMPYPEARAQLAERRVRVESLITRTGPVRPLEDVLSRIDDAIARIEAGTYGLCEVGHDAIEADRLRADDRTVMVIGRTTWREAGRRRAEPGERAGDERRRGWTGPSGRNWSSSAST